MQYKSSQFISSCFRVEQHPAKRMKTQTRMAPESFWPPHARYMLKSRGWAKNTWNNILKKSTRPSDCFIFVLLHCNFTTRVFEWIILGPQICQLIRSLRSEPHFDWALATRFNKIPRRICRCVFPFFYRIKIGHLKNNLHWTFGRTWLTYSPPFVLSVVWVCFGTRTAPFLLPGLSWWFCRKDIAFQCSYMSEPKTWRFHYQTYSMWGVRNCRIC